MNEKQKLDSLLGPFRALDLTDESGFLCGRILGDLGADVIKVEKPGGDTSRNIGPYYRDTIDPEKSLYWFAYNANKRGITLNIECSKGQEIFKILVKSADFLIESSPPGYMDSLGLGYSTISQINPRIIMTSITPFGPTGPYSSYKGSDIVVMAMGGFMYACGDSDRPPVRTSFPQSMLCAGAQAALGTVIAHYYRETTGEGQCVDVSMQETIVPLLVGIPIQWEFTKTIVPRSGARRVVGGASFPQQVIWPCKDDFVSWNLLGGAIGADRNRRLAEWMDTEGMAPEFLKKIDWEALDLANVTQEEYKQLVEPIGKFFMIHTKEELFERAQKLDLLLLPVCTVRDVVQDRHLESRSYWAEVQHPELGTTITYPGYFVKMEGTPCRIYRRAPLIGEHNQEIYEEELGMSKNEISILRQEKII